MREFYCKEASGLGFGIRAMQNRLGKRRSETQAIARVCGFVGSTLARYPVRVGIRLDRHQANPIRKADTVLGFWGMR